MHPLKLLPLKSWHYTWVIFTIRYSAQGGILAPQTPTLLPLIERTSLSFKSMPSQKCAENQLHRNNSILGIEVLVSKCMAHPHRTSSNGLLYTSFSSATSYCSLRTPATVWLLLVNMCLSPQQIRGPLQAELCFISLGLSSLTSKDLGDWPI